MKKILAVLTIIVSLLGCQSSDEECKNKLIGTWTSQFKMEDNIVNIKTSYFPNGTFEGAGTMADIELSCNGTWEVKDGYLCWEIKASNYPDILQPGFATCDQIIEITDETSRTKDSDGIVEVANKITN